MLRVTLFASSDGSGGWFRTEPSSSSLDVCELGREPEALAGQDLVVHTAAIVHAESQAERELQRRVNVEGTRSVVQACRLAGIPRLAHVSTVAAIGISPAPRTPADEQHAYNLAHLDLAYSRTKHEAERLVLEANHSRLETVVANPGFAFGAHRGRYRGGEVIERVLRRRIVPAPAVG